ncbi:hypothetical protein Aperf_G00000028104 [Anoplocephala perfoliata]
MSKVNEEHSLDFRALSVLEKKHSSSARTTQIQMKPEFLCPNCERKCANLHQCKHCCKDICHSCSTAHQTMYASVLLSRMLALHARYLRISRHLGELESVVSTEMFKKFQCQIEKDLIVAESCLQAMDILSEEKIRIRSEKLFDLSDLDNLLNDTGVEIANYMTHEGAIESNEDLNSKRGSPQSFAENDKLELDQPSTPVLLARSEYLYYQLLVKKSKVEAPSYEAVEEYFQKMDGVLKIYRLPSGCSGCIVFKSRVYAQAALKSRNHSVNGCGIKLIPISQLPKPFRETESQAVQAPKSGNLIPPLMSIQPSMLGASTSSVLPKTESQAVQAPKSGNLIPPLMSIQPSMLGASTSSVLPKTGNWISFEVMAMETEVHPLWLQTVQEYFLQFGNVVDIIKSRQGVSGYVAFSEESAALWALSFPMHSILGFPMRLAPRKD